MTRVSVIAMALSAALFVLVTVCYLAQPDCCAAVTVWPAWAWILLGAEISAIGCKGRGRRTVFVVLGLWLVCLLTLCEEPRSLLNGFLHGHPESAARQTGVLRVVSLNCSGGNPAAAREVIAYHPDIVLLQESPGPQEVHALARRLFGGKAGVAWGIDTSVIARGRVTADLSTQVAASCATASHVVVPGKGDMEVMSIRLYPPMFRTDVWSPANWRVQAALRRTHRRQVEDVTEKILSLDHATPVIVGGDFNMPAGDGALHELPPGLRDAFREGGMGWGNTVLNDVPVERYDQVWVSREFRVLSVRAYRTRNSDHRIVVCDVSR